MRCFPLGIAAYTRDPIKLAATLYPEVISLLVKLSISCPIVEPHPELVQPPPPEVSDNKTRNGVYLAGRLSPSTPADAGAAGSPDAVLEDHTLLCIYLPR